MNDNAQNTKDLTVSGVDRQNILNNPYALQEIEKATRIKGIPFEGKTVVLKEQVADFFEVTIRTIENYLGRHDRELAQNGYEIVKGKRLKELKLSISDSDVPETDFGNIEKAPQLGVFDFRAFLNMAMLIAESDRARALRQMMLDINPKNFKCIAKPHRGSRHGKKRGRSDRAAFYGFSPNFRKTDFTFCGKSSRCAARMFRLFESASVCFKSA